MLSPQPQQEALQLRDDRICEELAKGHYVTVLRHDKGFVCPHTGAWIGAIDLYIHGSWDEQYEQSIARIGDRRLAKSGRADGQHHVVLSPSRPKVDEYRARRK